MLRDARLWKADKCLVYGRCSTDLQDASIEDQLSSIRTEMAAQGITGFLHPPFVDDGLRGHDETRPGLRAILEYVRTHPSPVERNADFIPILVYDVSRFGRFDDPKKIFSYFVEIERYGYEFFSVSERIRSRGNIADWVQLIIRSEQAGQYSVDLSKYGLRTGCELAAKGWWPGGKPPYGYDRLTFGPDGKPKYRYRTHADRSVSKYSMDDVLLEVLPPVEIKGKRRSAYSDKLRSDKVRLIPGDPALVQVVQTIFKRYANEGKGLRKIASELNAKDVAPPRGKRWLISTVHSILANPVYVGSLVYGRRSDGKHHWLSIEKSEGGYRTRIEKKDVARRTFEHREIDDCIVVENAHPAIVAPEVWEFARKRMEENERAIEPGYRVDRANRSAYLLSGDGLMKCVSCGYSFQGDTHRRTGKRYYHDSGYHAGGKSVCSCSYVPAEEVEDWILDRVAQRLFGGRLFKLENSKDLENEIATLLPAAGAPETKEDEVGELTRRIEEKRKRASVILRIVDEETADMARDELKSLNREIKNLEVQVVEAKRRETSGASNPAEIARQISEVLWDFRRVIEEGTPDERKRLIRTFVGEIHVNAAKKSIRVGFYEMPGSGEAAPVGSGIFSPQLWCPQRDSNPCCGLEKPVS